MSEGLRSGNTAGLADCRRPALAEWQLSQLSREPSIGNGLFPVLEIASWHWWQTVSRYEALTVIILVNDALSAVAEPSCAKPMG
jgi:hypothetical protein